MDDWHWLTSLNQARAVAFGIEHFRSLYPAEPGHDRLAAERQLAGGLLGRGRLRRHPQAAVALASSAVYADRLLTFQPRPDETGAEVLALIAHNDSATAWAGELVITRRGTRRRHAGAGRAAPAAARSTPVPRSPWRWTPTCSPADDPAAEFLMASVVGELPATAFGYFVEDTALRLTGPEEAYEVDVLPVDGGYRVRLEAKALVKDATLFVDRLDPSARVDSALITLLAGASHTFQVSGPGLDEVALTGRPVLRSVNDLR